MSYMFRFLYFNIFQLVMSLGYVPRQASTSRKTSNTHQNIFTPSIFSCVWGGNAPKPCVNLCKSLGGLMGSECGKIGNW